VRPPVMADAPRGDDADPPRDHRHANAALVEIALDPAKAAAALEEDRITAAFLVRAVVADEQHERASFDVACAKYIDQPADVAIHAHDHRGECRVRRGLVTVPERR